MRSTGEANPRRGVINLHEVGGNVARTVDAHRLKGAQLLAGAAGGVGAAVGRVAENVKRVRSANADRMRDAAMAHPLFARIGGGGTAPATTRRRPVPPLAYMTSITHDKVSRMFRTIDTDHSGSISRSELLKYAKQVKLPQEYVADFMHYADYDHSGEIDIWEFRKAVAHKERALKAVFDAEDGNKTGRILVKDAEAALEKVVFTASHDQSSRKKIDPKEVKRLAEVLESQKKATLDFHDFVDLFALVPMASIESLTPYWVDAAHAHDLEFTGIASVKQEKKKGSPWGHLLAGATAGAVAKTVTSPLNVVCVQAMTSSGTKSMAALLQGTLKEEGVAGLFKGNKMNVIRSAPSKAMDFFMFEKFKVLVAGPDAAPTNTQRLVAGSLTGMASTTATYPMDVVATRLTASKGVYKSIPDAFIRIAKEEGVAELYAGLGPSLAGTIPYAGITFGLYEILRESYKKFSKETAPGVLPNMACGTTAGWAAMTASFPLEVVRRRLQVQGMPGQKKVYKGMGDCFAKMYKDEGVGVFYKGWGPASLKLVPAAGMTFMTYEVMKNLIKTLEVKAEEARLKKAIQA